MKTNPDNVDRRLLPVVLIQLIPSLAIMSATNVSLGILALSSLFSALVGGIATRQIEGEGRFILTTTFVVIGFHAVFFAKSGYVPSLWFQAPLVIGSALICGLFKCKKPQHSISNADSS